MRMTARLERLWRNLRHRDRVDRDLDDEVRSMFELLVEEKARAGMPHEDARRAALLELGRSEALKEQVRDVGATSLTLVGATSLTLSVRPRCRRSVQPR